MEKSPSLSAIESAPLAAEIPGWTAVTTIAVGGLEAVGFDEQSEELVIVSSQGQGIFDPISGECVFRDRDRDGYDGKTLTAQRGDNPDAPLIRMSGIHGGRLGTVTNDGWTLQTVVYKWPKARLVLCAPKHFLTPSRTPPHGKWFVLGDAYEFKVWGFSPTGQCLIWSDEVDIRLLRKEPAD